MGPPKGGRYPKKLGCSGRRSSASLALDVLPDHGLITPHGGDEKSASPEALADAISIPFSVQPRDVDATFPRIKLTTCDIVYFGGIKTNRCTWSIDGIPFVCLAAHESYFHRWTPVAAARLLPELSNCYCHPGTAGGTPMLLDWHARRDSNTRPLPSEAKIPAEV